MKHLRNQDGIALITALMFTLICLGMLMTLLYYVLAGTKMSAAQKRYRNSLEASYGGTEFVTKSLIPRLFASYSSNNWYSTSKDSLVADFGAAEKLGLTFPTTTLDTKLTRSTGDWPTTVSRTVDPKDAPDAVFTMKGLNTASDFKVYTKIVDTVKGEGVLDKTASADRDLGLAVSGSSDVHTSPRTPNIYTIEVQGEASLNPKEKGQLTVLYAY